MIFVGVLNCLILIWKDELCNKIKFIFVKIILLLGVIFLNVCFRLKKNFLSGFDYIVIYLCFVINREVRIYFMEG